MKTIFTNNVWKYLLGVLFVSFSLNTNAQSVVVNPSGPILCSGTKLDAVITNLNPPYTYEWSTGATTASIVVTQTGFYRVRVRGLNVQGNPRRINSPWYPIFVIPTTNAGVNANGPTTLCPGQTVQLSATGGQFFSSYEWSTGSSSKNITVGTTGDYTVTVTNNFGSCNSSTTATIHIDVIDANYHPTINANGPITVCQPGYVHLSADSGFSGYQWSTGATTQNVNVLLDGTGSAILDTMTVHLTVQVNNQCEFTDTSGLVIRSVREPELNAQYCGDFNLSLSDSVRSELVLTYLSFAPQYEFEFEETTNPGTTWSFVSNTRWCNLGNVTPALEAGKFYNVRVRAIIDGNSYCYGSVCQIGVPPANRPALSVATSLRIDGSALSASVSPNPSSESFKLVLSNLNNDQPATVRITDVSGRVVDVYQYDSAAGSLQFGEKLSNGVYFVSVEQGDANSVTRIIKTN